jgi:hypothetical protein
MQSMMARHWCSCWCSCSTSRTKHLAERYVKHLGEAHGCVAAAGALNKAAGETLLATQDSSRRHSFGAAASRQQQHSKEQHPAADHQQRVVVSCHAC